MVSGRLGNACQLHRGRTTDTKELTMRQRLGRFTPTMAVLAATGLATAGIVVIPAASQAAGNPIVVTSTIQAAVDAADPGDTVLVPAGTYSATVSVTEPGITIRGPQDAVLDGSGLGLQF